MQRDATTVEEYLACLCHAERGLELDMGESCGCFRQLYDLPPDTVGEAVGKIEIDEFVARHDASRGAR